MIRRSAVNNTMVNNGNSPASVATERSRRMKSDELLNKFQHAGKRVILTKPPFNPDDPDAENKFSDALAVLEALVAPEPTEDTSA